MTIHKNTPDHYHDSSGKYVKLGHSLAADEAIPIGTIEKGQDGNYYKRIESPGRRRRSGEGRIKPKYTSGVWQRATQIDLKDSSLRRDGAYQIGPSKKSKSKLI
jgi:hypothetical protein